VHYRVIASGALATASLMLAVPAFAATCTPGAEGIGDPYYPAYGNGGYDVSHYDLRLRYQPATDELEGTATLRARTTQDLSRFDLDFLLDVSEVRVNGVGAAFATVGEHELVITPRTGLAKGTDITVVVRYSGIPSSKQAYGFTTWLHASDGAVAANEPESAWWWFPSNDHPLDKATYDVSVQVPEGTQAISNGRLRSTRSGGGWTTCHWRSDKPQARQLHHRSHPAPDLCLHRRRQSAVEPPRLILERGRLAQDVLKRPVSRPAGGCPEVSDGGRPRLDQAGRRPMAPNATRHPPHVRPLPRPLSSKRPEARRAPLPPTPPVPTLRRMSLLAHSLVHLSVGLFVSWAHSHPWRWP
jgi:hypothetical protein